MRSPRREKDLLIDALDKITAGKTDLLPKFISKKGRPFSAHLKLEKGKVGFEFAERAPKAKKTPAKKAPAAKAD